MIAGTEAPVNVIVERRRGRITVTRYEPCPRAAYCGPVSAVFSSLRLMGM
jgi:hypothetical protein